MAAREDTRPDSGRKTPTDIAGIERCVIRVRPDAALGAVELEVAAADGGSGNCLLAPPSVFSLPLCC